MMDNITNKYNNNESGTISSYNLDNNYDSTSGIDNENNNINKIITIIDDPSYKKVKKQISTNDKQNIFINMRGNESNVNENLEEIHILFCGGFSHIRGFRFIFFKMYM